MPVGGETSQLSHTLKKKKKKKKNRCMKKSEKIENRRRCVWDCLRA